MSLKDGAKQNRAPVEARLLTKEEALGRMLSAWTPQVETELVPLSEAAGRVLAEDLTARYNIPVVRSSAMDGVAIRYADVAEGIPDTSAWQLGRDYVRADTGDDFPDDYDTVIPIEQVKLLPQGGLAFQEGLTIQPGMNVRPSGSQLTQGDLVGRKGTVLTAPALAAIGMGGYDQVTVVRRPRVGFVPTGSELVPVGQSLKRGQNYDTNSLMAAQMIRDMGGEAVLHPLIPDDRNALEQAVNALLPLVDILILNAGTSKGDEDYCGRLLERSGGLFHGVAAVPGRPMSGAVIAGKPVLNISGPALAAFYSLDWMLRALVCRYLGVPVPKRQTVQAVLTAPLRCPKPMSMLCMMDVSRQPDGSFAATPLALRGPNAVRVGRQLLANGLYVTTPGEPDHQPGEIIEAELLSCQA